MNLWEDWNEEDYFAPAYNVYGVACSTWSEACEVAGVETPAQAAAEDRWYRQEDHIREQDRLHAGSTGVQYGRRHWAHKICYVESGKPFDKLNRSQIESLPFRALQRHNRLAEVEALLADPAHTPKR